MIPTRDIPADYVPVGSIDIATDRRLLLGLNLLGLVLLVLSAWFFTRLLFVLRPDEGAASLEVEISGLGQFALLVVGLLVLSAVMVALHEAAHGLFFWLFSGSRPRFAFKGVYAYTAMPGWYFPRRFYAVVGLAPLLLLDLAVVLLLKVVPTGWLAALILFLVSNTAGSVGDLWVVTWLLTSPPGTLAEDRGDAVVFYHQRAC